MDKALFQRKTGFQKSSKLFVISRRIRPAGACLTKSDMHYKGNEKWPIFDRLEIVINRGGTAVYKSLFNCSNEKFTRRVYYEAHSGRLDEPSCSSTFDREEVYPDSPEAAVSVRKKKQGGRLQFSRRKGDVAGFEQSQNSHRRYFAAVNRTKQKDFRYDSVDTLDEYPTMKEATEDYLQNLKVILRKKSVQATGSQAILNRTLINPNELDIHTSHNSKWPIFNRPYIVVNQEDVVFRTQLPSADDDEYNRQIVYESAPNIPKQNGRSHEVADAEIVNQQEEVIREDTDKCKTRSLNHGYHRDNRQSTSTDRNYRRRSKDSHYRRSKSPYYHSRSPSRSPSRRHHCRCECRSRRRSRSPYYRSRHQSCSPARRADHHSEITRTVPSNIRNPMIAPLLASCGPPKALYWVPKTLLSQVMAPPMPRRFIQAPFVAAPPFGPRQPYRFRPHNFPAHPRGQTFKGPSMESDIDKPTSTSK